MMRVRFNDQMVCEVYQHNEALSVQQGQYIDLKSAPERSQELPEAKEWPELGHFMEAVNRIPAFLTCGSTASGETAGGHEAPFVDIAFAESPLRTSTHACNALGSDFLQLDGIDIAGGLTIELVECSATFPDGERVASIRLWLLGPKELAEKAFPAVLEFLSQRDPEDYMELAEREFEAAQREQRLRKMRLARFFLIWFASACIGAFAGSYFGWLGGILGFLGGAVAFLFLIVCLFLWATR